MRPRLYYCDCYTIPLPEGHRFPMEKYRMLRERLAASDVFDFAPAPFAAPETVAEVHDPEYVTRFVEGRLGEGVMRRIGFPWSEALVRRTMASVGGTIGAAGDALQHGWGGNLAGGTHHASRGEGAGFCVFNDIAVAVEVLRREHSLRRLAVVDLDVHQGDGTASFFEDDPAVLTVSLHGRNNFPFRKRAGKIDVGLEDGTGDDEYLRRLAEVLPAVFAFEPEVIFYQAGVDALAADRLGRLSLTAEGLRARDRTLCAACLERRIPLVITLGGGYAEPIERTVAAHACTFLTAAELWGRGRVQSGADDLSADTAVPGHRRDDPPI
jgi:acetoin utilization deacetylase AcuC-like enzyme